MKEDAIKELLAKRDQYNIPHLYFSHRVNCPNLFESIDEIKFMLGHIIEDNLYPKDAVYNPLAGDTSVYTINMTDECICKLVKEILKHREDRISTGISSLVTDLIESIPEKPDKDQHPVFLKRLREMLEAVYSSLASLSSTGRDEVFAGVLALKYYALMIAAYNSYKPISQKYTADMIGIYGDLYEKERLLREKHRIDIMRQWVR